MNPSALNPDWYYLSLLRHGESVGNAEEKHQGQADFPLTNKGKAQVEALVERWQRENKTFDLIISSPLSRALGTAKIISESLHLPLDLNPLWMERDNGLLAGLRPEEATVTYPQPSFIHPYLPIGQTGESQWELYLRAGKAVQEILHMPPGNYLIVSHGGILNMALYSVLGITPQANFYGPRFRFENSAFATLRYKPGEHKWYIYGINDHAHWPSEEN